MIPTIIYSIYGLAAVCELALIVRACRGSHRSTLDAIRAHRSRIVRDLRGVSLYHRETER